MNERLKEAFDAVHAEEELKEKTKDFVMSRTEAGNILLYTSPSPRD